MKRTIIAVLSLLIFAGVALTTTVYITDTGKKYHQTGCQYLSRSRHSVSLEQAKIRGYTPCAVCVLASPSAAPGLPTLINPKVHFRFPKKNCRPIWPVEIAAPSTLEKISYARGNAFLSTKGSSPWLGWFSKLRSRRSLRPPCWPGPMTLSKKLSSDPATGGFILRARLHQRI